VINRKCYYLSNRGSIITHTQVRGPSRPCLHWLHLPAHSTATSLKRQIQNDTIPSEFLKHIQRIC